jgi:predicted nucleic acid-binding protein
MSRGHPTHVLDANVLIAASNPANAWYELALAALVSIPRGERGIHPVNLAEVLVGPAMSGQAEQASREWLGLGIVLVGDDVVSPAAVAAIRAQTGLRLPDSYALASAQLLGATLVSFDIRMRQVATRHDVAISPELPAD